MPKNSRFKIDRRLRLTLVTSLILLCILSTTYYLRNISNTYYFQRYQPPISCTNKTESACFVGKLYVETVTGDEVLFTYTTADPPKVINDSGLISSFKKGEKIQVKTSGDNTGDDKVVRSIRAVD